MRGGERKLVNGLVWECSKHSHTKENGPRTGPVFCQGSMAFLGCRDHHRDDHGRQYEQEKQTSHHGLGLLLRLFVVFLLCEAGKIEPLAIADIEAEMRGR